MTEERKEAQEQVATTSEQYPHLLPWESAGPMLAPPPGWFSGTAGFLTVRVTYYLHKQGVLFVAVIVTPSAPAHVWLRHWTSHIEAIRGAENLLAEAEAYLRQQTHGQAMRETEDLDYDDFVAHLQTRMNGEFH